MIERRNIIKLLSERTNTFHSAILTCYNFDSIFFESIYLPTLLRAGITNIIVMMDAKMYDSMLSDTAYHCHQVHMNRYTLVRQENSYGGVFHSKIVLLFGNNEGTVIVGSGNLTFSGISNNTEVWNVFHINDATSPNFPIIKNAWEYIKGLLTNSSYLIKRQIGWIEEQSIWITNPSTHANIKLESGETATFLYNSENKTIFEALVDAIGNSKVNEITIVAPFYDSKGEAIKKLQMVFNPKTIHCLIDINNQSAPYDLFDKSNNIYFYHYDNDNATLHAKIIELQTSNGSWLLSGSANIGTMALGTIKKRFNDEACILINSSKHKEYIEELGLNNYFKIITKKELEGHNKPPYNIPPVCHNRITIIYCEICNDSIELNVSEKGLLCDIVIFNNEMQIIDSKEIITDFRMSISAISNAYIVVLKKDGKEISNRCLVVNEEKVEYCNPDPKLRKLSSILNDSGLMDNLSHILGYIEFDNDTREYNLQSTSHNDTIKIDTNDIDVSSDRFNELKQNSNTNINLHSGIRILTFLQNILFNYEKDDKNEEESLLALKEENEGINRLDGNTKESKQSSVDKAKRMRNNVHSFLCKMKKFIEMKIDDPTSQNEGISSLPLENSHNNLPKLISVPNLNQSSSFAIATTIMFYLMDNYGKGIEQKIELRDCFTDTMCLYLALYGQNFETEGNTYKSKKIHKMLKDATTMLFVSLCYFNFPSDSKCELILSVLNSLDAWRNEKYVLSEIITDFKKRIEDLDTRKLNPQTYDTIIKLYEMYVSGEIPINHFKESDEELYVYRTGYGFFNVYDISFINNSWRYSYYHPRYQYRNFNPKGGNKYKGYSFPNI